MAPYVIGNWKMNLLEGDSVALAKAIVEFCRGITNVESWIAPSFLSIPAVSKVVAGSQVKLGSQNIHGEAKGTFTGEVSCSMLKEFGGTFSLIGHSERRQVLGESDALVAKKAAGALQQGITPVFCVGENLEERDRGLTHEVLKIQLDALIEAIPGSSLSDVIIAYEPCWAISSGTIWTKGSAPLPTPEVIELAHGTIAAICVEGSGVKPKAIIYGGSAAPDNFKEFLAVPNVDGGLVGGASLKAESFSKLIEIAAGSGK